MSLGEPSRASRGTAAKARSVNAGSQTLRAPEMSVSAFGLRRENCTHQPKELQFQKKTLAGRRTAQSGPGLAPPPGGARWFRMTPRRVNPLGWRSFLRGQLPRPSRVRSPRSGSEARQLACFLPSPAQHSPRTRGGTARHPDRPALTGCIVPVPLLR